MANRKQPFGYKMEQGRTVVNPQEREVVQMIFAQYNNGTSLGALAQMLNEQEILYEDSKPWNKNMAARILADRRYLGIKGYPVLMDEISFRKAGEKREKKQCPVQKTATQKALRRLSGQAVTSSMEQRMLEILNHLIRNPEQISSPANALRCVGETADTATVLRAALDEELDQQPVDEEAAKSLIFQIAAAQYEAIRSEEYETRRLQHIFSKHCSMQKLSAEFVQDVIRKIHIERNQLAIELKNGQILQVSV